MIKDTLTGCRDSTKYQKAMTPWTSTNHEMMIVARSIRRWQQHSKAPIVGWWWKTKNRIVITRLEISPKPCHAMLKIKNHRVWDDGYVMNKHRLSDDGSRQSVKNCWLDQQDWEIRWWWHDEEVKIVEWWWCQIKNKNPKIARSTSTKNQMRTIGWRVNRVQMGRRTEVEMNKAVHRCTQYVWAPDSSPKA